MQEGKKTQLCLVSNGPSLLAGVKIRVVKAKRLFRGKRLKKAVKRLKGCYDLVTAFWPKIIPLSEHQF